MSQKKRSIAAGIPRTIRTMESDPYFFVCPICNSAVDPDAPHTVFAHEQIKVATMGGDELADGLPAYIHAFCYRRQGRGWRPARRPRVA